MALKFESTDFADYADYADYNQCELENVKTARFNSPWLAAVKFILKYDQNDLVKGKRAYRQF